MLLSIFPVAERLSHSKMLSLRGDTGHRAEVGYVFVSFESWGQQDAWCCLWEADNIKYSLMWGKENKLHTMFSLCYQRVRLIQFSRECHLQQTLSLPLKSLPKSRSPAILPISRINLLCRGNLAGSAERASTKLCLAQPSCAEYTKEPLCPVPLIALQVVMKLIAVSGCSLWKFLRLCVLTVKTRKPETGFRFSFYRPEHDDYLYLGTTLSPVVLSGAKCTL